MLVCILCDDIQILVRGLSQEELLKLQKQEMATRTTVKTQKQMKETQHQCGVPQDRLLWKSSL